MSVMSVMSVMLVILVMGIQGCHSPYTGDVTVTPAPSFKEDSGLLPTIQVDLIGATALELQRWKTYPVTDYWSVDGSLRKTAKKQSFVMTTEAPGPFLSTNWADVRSDWKKAGVTSIVIIADLPGAWQKRPADAKGAPPRGVQWYEPGQDPRRLIIPWVQQAYGFFTHDIEIALEPTGIVLKTPVDMSKAVPASGS
jgi:hypothetical protein